MRQRFQDKQLRPSKRRKAKSLVRRWWKLSLRHTWLNPLILVLIIVAAYLVNPNETNPLHAALFLSYPLPKSPDADPSTPIHYGKGAKDFAFVAFYIIVLSFTREFLMQRLLRPLSIRCGIRSRAKQARFMEQVYTAIYFGIFGPFGLYVMSRTPVWYFNTKGMYEGFPHKTHEAVFKAYYLLQASYWAQQAIVLLLMLEKPRKDFKELVMHHIITIALIWCSYRFHFTYMGVAVYITHDISDFFLAVSPLFCTALTRRLLTMQRRRKRSTTSIRPSSALILASSYLSGPTSATTSTSTFSGPWSMANTRPSVPLSSTGRRNNTSAGSRSTLRLLCLLACRP